MDPPQFLKSKKMRSFSSLFAFAFSDFSSRSFVRRDSLARSDGWIGGGGPCSLGPVLFVPSIAGFALAVVTPEATEGRAGKKGKGGRRRSSCMQHLIEESENRDLHSIHHESHSVRISFPRHAYMPNSKYANTFGDRQKMTKDISTHQKYETISDLSSVLSGAGSRGGGGGKERELPSLPLGRSRGFIRCIQGTRRRRRRRRSRPMHYKQGKGKSGRGRKRCFCFYFWVRSGRVRSGRASSAPGGRTGQAQEALSTARNWKQCRQTKKVPF